MNNQLQVILDEQNIAKENAKQLIEAFGAPFEEAGAILASYDKIVVKGEDDFAAMAEAREKRLALKNVRTSVERKRKELKEDIVRSGRAIDSVARFVKEAIEPAESYLETQEKFAEIKAAERKAAKKAERLERLNKIGADASMYNLDDMDDVKFDELIAKLEADKKAAEEAAAKADAERLAAIEAEKKRQAEIEAENARLKKEAEEREKAVAAERAKLQAETEKREAAERAERERIQAENEKKLAAERAMADEERKKREALEAERRASDAEEARKKAAVEEAERQALLAPDKEKIVAFANALSVLRSQAPTVKSQEAQELLNSVDTAIAGFVEKILVKAKSL